MWQYLIHIHSIQQAISWSNAKVVGGAPKYMFIRWTKIESSRFCEGGWGLAI